VLNFEVNGRTSEERAIDHLNQFAALGAWLAIPEQDGGFRLFKELRSRHPRGYHTDDLADINRLGFSEEVREDAERDSVKELARELGMPGAPYVLAFFPDSLQEKMRQMEASHRHKSEDRIGPDEKMYFQVVPRGLGYEVVATQPTRR
jgi:hypothetical protein